MRASETATPFIPPATEVERKLAAIFQELLGMNEIGVDDNFFDLGANSLMMVRVVEKIRAELGLQDVRRSCFPVSNVKQLGRRNREIPSTESRQHCSAAGAKPWPASQGNDAAKTRDTERLQDQ